MIKSLFLKKKKKNDRPCRLSGRKRVLVATRELLLRWSQACVPRGRHTSRVTEHVPLSICYLALAHATLRMPLGPEYFMDTLSGKIIDDRTLEERADRFFVGSVYQIVN